MKFAPIGVFGLVAKVVAEAGFSAVRPLAVFAVTVLVALTLHIAIIMPLFLRFVAKVQAYKMFPAMAPAMLTAFSTSSSSATLPITMECVEENVGVSNKISSFVLPLGATVNMNGTALYECAAAMFLAQAYGLDLTLGVQFSIVFIASSIRPSFHNISALVSDLGGSGLVGIITLGILYALFRR